MAKDIKSKPVTRGMLGEAVDTLLSGMDQLFGRFKAELAPVKEDVQTLKTELAFIKRDIEDIKGELSDTPSQRQFNELKARVDKHLPLS